jgi:hypothetical protein
MKNAITLQRSNVPTSVPFSSNAIRLTPRQWGVTAAALLALFIFVPLLWRNVETFDAGPDFRIPYKLSTDYWLYDRYCWMAASAEKMPLLGDSVVWGQYVNADETLSHYLNALSKNVPTFERSNVQTSFANMGMDGMHPAALEGLIQYYGKAISEMDVLVLCNPLWLTSAKADLQYDKEFSFNHPKLVPQLHPRIPCYTETLSGRVGVVVERSVPFLGWTNHLRVAYFESTDIPGWTMENPYANPLGQINLQPVPKEEKHKRRPALWTGKESDRQDFQWVELDRSFQWRCFRRAVECLQRRGNRVFVLVGPFNEHMLVKASLERYLKIKEGIVAWLRKKNIPHFAPAPLPSEQYADASHPLARGYELLATELMNNEAFKSAILSRAARGSHTPEAR